MVSPPSASSSVRPLSLASVERRAPRIPIDQPVHRLRVELLVRDCGAAEGAVSPEGGVGTADAHATQRPAHAPWSILKASVPLWLRYR